VKNSEILKKNDTAKFTVGKAILYILLILLAILCFLPFYIMIINATHSNTELSSKLMLLPGKSLMDNYRRLMQNVNIWRGFFNSLFISTCVTILSGYFSALTAYGFSKFKFKGNKALYWVVLGTMMIPGQLGLIGFFQLCKSLNMLNTYWPLILPSIANAGTVFFIKGYTDSAIHISLIESARIDGCGEFKIFNRIVLPLIIPSVATMSIFTFVNSWNNFLTPLVLLFDMDKFTLPILVVVARGVYQTDFGAIYTGIAISVVPIMIVFIFMSKYIIGGLTTGSVKG
jgi:multiple sugar transport system permease protein